MSNSLRAAAFLLMGLVAASLVAGAGIAFIHDRRAKSAIAQEQAAFAALVDRLDQVGTKTAQRLDALAAEQAAIKAALAAINPMLAAAKTGQDSIGGQVSGIATSQAAIAQALGERLAKVVDEMPAVRDSQRLVERELAQLREDIVATNFALAKPTSPESIVLGPLDTYESLDRNWHTQRDTSGRQPVTCRRTDVHTAVIVILGQSNAGNHMPTPYAPERGGDREFQSL